MATFDLLITYPDGEQVRILTALKAQYYGTITDALGNPVVLTNAQAIEAFRKEVMQRLKDIVFSQENKNAVTQAASTVVPVNPT